MKTNPTDVLAADLLAAGLSANGDEAARDRAFAALYLTQYKPADFDQVGGGGWGNLLAAVSEARAVLLS